jgi:hypothetical protein
VTPERLRISREISRLFGLLLRQRPEDPEVSRRLDELLQLSRRSGAIRPE